MNGVRFKIERSDKVFKWKTLSLMNEENQELGFAYYFYINKPFPVYFIDELHIYKEVAGTPTRGKGYGTLAMQKLMRVIKKRGAAGMLRDGTGRSEDVDNIYQKLGWLKIGTGSRSAFRHSPVRIWNPPFGTTMKDWREAIKAAEATQRKIPIRSRNSTRSSSRLKKK